MTVGPHAGTSLSVKIWRVQCFSICVAVAAAQAAELSVGEYCRCTLTDIAQRTLSTADGRVSVITTVTRAKQHDAVIVGNRVPQHYYGDPALRFVTMVNLQNFSGALRGMTSAFVRRRFDLEIQRLQPIYRSMGRNRDPREDLFIVPDFDGRAMSQLGISGGATKTNVFVLTGDGRVVAHWSKLPPAEDLLAALESARGQETQ
ncbi:MAG: hypothetical protein ACJ8KU_05870 [Chthoniobacterales bacterium]